MPARNDGSYHVVLIDDDEDEHVLFQEAIEEIGYVSNMTALNTCEKLIDYLIVKAEKPPDLIFLDVNMPRMNGIECLEQIRKEKRLNELPVVMYTNSLRKEDIIACYNLGANIFVTKPFSFQDEVLLIRKILSFYNRQLFASSSINSTDLPTK